MNLWRDPAYSAVAVATLSVGIGASIAMFTVIQSVLLRPLPYECPEELVMLWHRYERTGADKVRIAPPDFADFRERATTLTEFAALRNTGVLPWPNCGGRRRAVASCRSLRGLAPSVHLFTVEFTKIRVTG